MKTVILCGGYGTRIRDVSEDLPKPMIPVGRLPILWHLMKYYSSFGHNDFVLCLGHKGQVIKDFFLNYESNTRDCTISLGSKQEITFHTKHDEQDWKVTLADTGLETMTGGRIAKIQQYVDDETFFLTYGDGLSDVNITELIAFHKAQQVKATVTAVLPPGRFGALDVTGNRVNSFREKPQGDGANVNGGFFVLSTKVIDYISGDKTIWERGPIERLAKEGELAAFQHSGFWQPMDTMRDKVHLEELWQSGKAPWKVWQ